MKLTIKTLQQKQFSLEVADNVTVRELKALIEKQENHPADWQKLIHTGKILEDDKPVSSYNISETDFLVLMVRKPATAAAPKPAEPTPAASTPSTSTPSASTTASASSAPSTTPATPSTPAQATTPSTPSAPASSAPVSSELEGVISNLCEMGFPRDEVMAALRAAYNNPDRAVEYLTNGIPPGLDMPRAVPAPTQSAPAPQSPAPSSGNQGSSTGQHDAQPQSPPPNVASTPLIPPHLLPQQQQQPAGPQGSGALDFLREHPQFEMLRQLVQANPQLLQTVLQNLGQQNPQLLQLINQHPQELLALLNAPPSQGGQGGGQSGASYIQVTQEEKAAIERLEALGFDRSRVLEAFLACERNEELAANYLFEHQEDEYMDD